MKSFLVLQIGFRMFLSASASVSSWNADNTACNLVGAVTTRFAVDNMTPVLIL